LFYWVISLNKRIGLDPENYTHWHLSERFPQYLKIEGGPTFNFYLCFLILFLFRLYGVVYRGFTRLEAVGLVCNLSGKLLSGIFSGQVVQFFLQPPCLETSDDEFFPLYSYNKYLCIVLFSWRSEAVKSYFNCSTGAEPKNS
jgi:hypothetical protein